MSYTVAYHCRRCEPETVFPNVPRLLAHARDVHGIEPPVALEATQRLGMALDGINWYRNEMLYTLAGETEPWAARIEEGDREGMPWPL